MAPFEDFDLETQNEKDSDPEQFEDSVGTAGSPETLTPTNTKPIQLAFIYNPNRGDNANGFGDVLYITIDGSLNKTSIPRGESRFFPGVFSSLSIDSNNNNVNFEVILWS